MKSRQAKRVAPTYLERTIAPSSTGAVVSVSMVPMRNSSAKTRMVISGKMRMNGYQKIAPEKNDWTSVPWVTSMALLLAPAIISQVLRPMRKRK